MRIAKDTGDKDPADGPHGADADLMVLDPAKEKVISAKTQQSAIDYNVFEGHKVKGLPRFVLTRGQVAIDDGAVKTQEGHGQFVGREARPAVNRALSQWKELTAPRPVQDEARKAAMQDAAAKANLYAAAAGTADKVSLATVYNTLRAFCDAGLMNEVVVDGSRSYFDTRLDDHPHFYWEETGVLTDAPAAQLKIAELPAAPEGAEIARVDVVIRLRKA